MMTADAEDEVVAWATRVPGQPWRYGFRIVSSVEADFVAAVECPVHHEALTPRGVCIPCVRDWYALLGYDPNLAAPCRICRAPLHPSIVAAGHDVHDCCDCEDEA